MGIGNHTAEHTHTKNTPTGRNRNHSKNTHDQNHYHRNRGRVQQIPITNRTPFNREINQHQRKLQQIINQNKPITIRSRITRIHQKLPSEFLFKAKEKPPENRSPMGVAGIPARTAGNRYWDRHRRWPMEDRVWVSSEGRVSAPVLLGFGSFWVRRVLSSLHRFLEQRPPEIADLRWSSPGFTLSLSRASSLSLSVSLRFSLSCSLYLKKEEKKGRKEIGRRKGTGSLSSLDFLSYLHSSLSNSSLISHHSQLPLSPTIVPFRRLRRKQGKKEQEEKRNEEEMKRDK